MAVRFDRNDDASARFELIDDGVRKQFFSIQDNRVERRGVGPAFCRVTVAGDNIASEVQAYQIGPGSIGYSFGIIERINFPSQQSQNRSLISRTSAHFQNAAGR